MQHSLGTSQFEINNHIGDISVELMLCILFTSVNKELENTLGPKLP